MNKCIFICPKKENGSFDIVINVVTESIGIKNDKNYEILTVYYDEENGEPYDTLDTMNLDKEDISIIIVITEKKNISSYEWVNLFYKQKGKVPICFFKGKWFMCCTGVYIKISKTNDSIKAYNLKSNKIEYLAEDCQVEAIYAGKITVRFY